MEVFYFHVTQTGGRGAVSKYEKIPPDGVTLNPEKIMKGLLKIKKCIAFSDISRKCPYMKNIVKDKKTFPTKICGTYPNGQCPVIFITNEIGRMASFGKRICEVMKKILPYDGDLNKYYHKILKDNKGNIIKTTSNIFQDLTSVKFFGGGKLIGYFLAVLGCPNDGIMHWEIDCSTPELAPVDVNTERLSKRFEFVKESVTCKDIQQALKALYPKEPRKLDFALYALGSNQELNICGKHPDCKQCKKRLPRVFQLCPATSKYT